MTALNDFTNTLKSKVELMDQLTDIVSVFTWHSSYTLLLYVGWETFWISACPTSRAKESQI